MILPIYNGQAYIGEALRSVLAQTYRPMEVVLIDDGSKDDSLRIVREVIARHAPADFAVVLEARSNGGLSSARNLGMKLASGDVIGFIDHDDYIPPERTRVLMDGLLKSEADIAFGQTARFKRLEDLSTAYVEPDPPFRVEGRPPYFKMFPNVQGFLAIRELLESVGEFRLDLDAAAEDVDYVVRMRLRSRRMVRTDAVCYYYRYSENSMTSALTSRFVNSKLRFAQYAAESLVAEGKATPVEGLALSKYLKGCIGGFMKLGHREGVLMALQARRSNRRSFGHADTTTAMEWLMAMPGGFELMRRTQQFRLKMISARDRRHARPLR
jgi:glycosyltransferase involved in cell wall biosynthesis